MVLFVLPQNWLILHVVQDPTFGKIDLAFRETARLLTLLHSMLVAMKKERLKRKVRIFQTCISKPGGKTASCSKVDPHKASLDDRCNACRSCLSFLTSATAKTNPTSSFIRSFSALSQLHLQPSVSSPHFHRLLHSLHSLQTQIRLNCSRNQDGHPRGPLQPSVIPRE